MSEETTRVPPASPWNKTKSVGSASKTDATRVRSASPRTGTTRVGSASPKNDSARVRSASPRTETAPVRSASPRTETKRVRPASPRTEATQVAPASPRTKLRGDDSMRSFEISPGSLTSNGKIIPNYLRPSTGSCHDLCKHGIRHEHANDVKESRPWRKSIEGNGADSVPTKDYKALTGTKKTGVVKPKPSADPKIQPPSRENVMQKILATACEQVDVPNEQTLSDTRAYVSDELFASDGTEMSSTGGKEKQEFSEPSGNVTVTEKETSLDAKSLKCSKMSSRSPSPISKGASAERNILGRKNVDRRMSLDGRKPFEGRKSPDQTGRRGLEMRKSLDGKKNTGMRTGDLIFSSAETNGEGSNKYNADDKILPATNDSENGTSLNLETNKKNGSLGNSKNDAESELLKKQAAASKPKIVKMKPLPSKYPSALKPLSPVHPFSVMRSSKSGDNQLPGKIPTSRVDAKKVGIATKYPSSRSSVNKEENTSTKKVGFIRLVSSTKRDNKVTAVNEKDRNEQDAQEDTVSSVKIPPEKDSPPASTKVKSKSSITLLPPVLAVSKTTIGSRTSYKPPHLKKSPVGPQSKSTEKGPSVLRKGKAIGMESENHGPSKPKVRKNSLPNETTHINKPSLMTRNVPVRSRDTVKNSNSNSNSSGRYLFKYPSIGRKKNTHGLFNKVIEETAKRLVRTKKSNVLALVGAFETVISIQKKSSAAAARPKAKKISSFKKHPR